MSIANQQKRQRSMARQARKNEALKRINRGPVLVAYSPAVCAGQLYLARHQLPHSQKIAALA